MTTLASDQMVYKFRNGSRVPAGVTPEGILAEREMIEQRCGKASIENSVTAVLTHPTEYPNLRAFCPKDEEEAMRRASADGIRRAYQSVVIIRENTDEPKAPPREIRVLHSVHDSAGDPVFETLTVISRSEVKRRELIDQLQKDARTFYLRMIDVLAEVAELI